eukprot:jgi/Orpsp1_1/1183040/evm.model.c7180000083627.1
MTLIFSFYLFNTFKRKKIFPVNVTKEINIGNDVSFEYILCENINDYILFKYDSCENNNELTGISS